MKEREKREAIKWEDTLSKSELAYTERLQAENETIQVFNKAREEDQISGYLQALSSDVVPKEFIHVKGEFQLRIHELIEELAQLTHLKARSYNGEGTIYMHIEHRYESLVDINTRKKYLHINGKRWVNEFSKYLDEDLFAWREEWLEYKSKKLAGRVAKSNEDFLHEVEKLKQDKRLIEKERAEWERAELFPPAHEIIQEVDRIIEVMEREGYAVYIDGMERKSHYMLKSRYRWEEDHSHKLSKLQRKFARPVNQPTMSQRNTHFASGIVERSIGCLYVLTTPGNKSTIDFYERRFTEEEWKKIRSIPSLSKFRVESGLEVVQMKYQPTGTVISIYPNGNILVDVPQESDDSLLATRVGLLPFLWHPAVKEILKEMGDQMNHY